MTRKDKIEALMITAIAASALAFFFLIGPPIATGQVTGGGGRLVTSGQIPDPYVVPDGTWNVTGGLTATGTVAGNALSSSTTMLASGNVCGGGSVVCMGNTTIHSGVEVVGASGSSLWASGQPTDGAGGIGIEIGSYTNLTVSGAKLVRFCNNLTSGSCTEGGYVDRAGLINGVGGVRPGLDTNSAITRTSGGSNATINWGATASFTTDTLTMTTTGDAQIGDSCELGLTATAPTDSALWCSVTTTSTTAPTVTLYRRCINSVACTDPAADTYRVRTYNP